MSGVFTDGEQERRAESSSIAANNIKPLVRHLKSEDGTPESQNASGGMDEIETDIIQTAHTPRFEEHLLKTYLDETLLVLIAARDGACGKELTADLQRLGYDVSPGTLYPHLHDLVDQGMLEVRELVRTKEFSIANPNQARTRLDETIQQLSDLALLFADHIDDVHNQRDDGIE